LGATLILIDDTSSAASGFGSRNRLAFSAALFDLLIEVENSV